MRTSSLQRNNVRVLGDGPDTIILAHGFGTDQTAWQHQVAMLRSRYPQRRLVLFDHVGAGHSDVSAYSPHRYRSLHGYAEDLLAICADLKIQAATLIGHSVSGMVSLLAALIDPSRFRQLIFIGASPCYLNDAPARYVGGFEQADLDHLYASMSANYHAWVAGFAPLVMGNTDRPELARALAKTLAAIRPDIAQAVVRVIFQSDHRADLHRLQVPTVIMQSDQDVAVPPEVGQFMAKHIPQSRLLAIEATGHLPHLSAPQVVNQALATCLSGAS